MCAYIGKVVSMRIQSFGNFLIKKTQNSFSTNRYSQNPINFKGGIEKDTVELHSTSQEKADNIPAIYLKQKDETLKKFEQRFSSLQTALNNKELAALSQLENDKKVIMQIITDEDFLPQIEKHIQDYKKERFQTQSLLEINDTLNKPKMSRRAKEALLAEKIGENFPEYISQAQKDGYGSIDIIGVAKELVADGGLKNGEYDPVYIFDSRIVKTINEYEVKNSVQIPVSVRGAISNATYKSFHGSPVNLKEVVSDTLDAMTHGVFDNFRENRKIMSLEMQRREYLEHFEDDPVTACLYSPFVHPNDLHSELLATGVFKSLASSDELADALKSSGLIIPSQFDKPIYRIYDLRNMQNKKIFDLIDNEAYYATQKQTAKYYDIPEYYLKKLPLKRLSLDGIENLNGFCPSEFINREDSETKLLLEAESKKWERTRPERSPYRIGEEIPAKYLASLGFGNVAILRQMVETGQLSGRFVKVQTEDGPRLRTLVNTNDKRFQETLRKLRDDNKGVSSCKELAKELGITQRQLLSDIANGKIDIIPEYLFVFDNEAKYIDKRIEKNKAYIETTLFEQEAMRQLKQEQLAQKQKDVKQKKIQNMGGLNKFNSLRMSLVWHFCPNTRNVASNLAKKDGHLCALLVKEAEEEDSLTPKEQIKINSYRKEMWLRSGTEELKEGFRKAGEVLKQFKESGLSAIEDEEVRKILEDYQK